MQRTARRAKSHADATESLAKAIEQSLAVGNFADAMKACDDNRVAARHLLTKTTAYHPGAIRLAGVFAECHAYLGENRKASNVLSPYLSSSEAQQRFFVCVDAPARARLQLAEVLYAQGQIIAAIEGARRVLTEARARGQHWDAGVTYYYLARFHARQHRMADSALYCAKAVESLCLGDRTRAELLWRMGLIFVVQGYANWRSGQHISARARLYVALALLKGSGDVVSIGNARQSLGCVLRSQGHYEQAVEEFTQAKKLYGTERLTHALNTARVLTNLGRTASLSKQWTVATDYFNEALKLVSSRSTREDRLWRRQEAEIYIWQSRFLQAKGPAAALGTAEECAVRARTIAREVRSTSNFIEANLALATCYRLQGRTVEAWHCADEALADAIQTAVPKLVVSAQLIKAELLASGNSKELGEAERLLRDAWAQMDTFSTQGSSADGTSVSAACLNDVDGALNHGFLRQRALHVKGLLESGPDTLIFARGQIRETDKDGTLKTDGLTLKQIVAAAKRWAISTALEKNNKSSSHAARALGVTRQALYLMQRRERRNNNGPRLDPKKPAEASARASKPKRG